jgi:hypothetical protein
MPFHRAVEIIHEIVFFKLSMISKAKTTSPLAKNHLLEGSSRQNGKSKVSCITNTANCFFHFNAEIPQANDF